MTTHVTFSLGGLGLDAPEPDDRRIYGVAVAMVINNIDLLGEGRVQLQLPWLPMVMPWARVAVPMAGMGRGTYFIPQIGDEVLVAFNQGDIREPYVIGSLWNTLDRPPALLQTDPVTRRAIRSPLGNELAFDEKLQNITLSTQMGIHTVTIGPTGIDLLVSMGSTASVKLGIDGTVSIFALHEIKLDAPVIKVGDTIAADVTLKGTASATVDGGASCSVRGAAIAIG